jgi:predicted secreted protein
MQMRSKRLRVQVGKKTQSGPLEHSGVVTTQNEGTGGWRYKIGRQRVLTISSRISSSMIDTVSTSR